MKTTHIVARRLTAALLCCALVVSGSATGRVNHEGTASIDKTGGDHRAKVVSRLIELGYSEEEAAARADEMTDAELAYFAANPEAIERSGFIILSSLVASSVQTTINNKKKKEAAEEARARMAEEEVRAAEARERRAAEARERRAAERARAADARADRIERKIQNAQMELNSKTMLLTNETDPRKKVRLEEQIKLLEEKIRSLENDRDDN